MNISRSIERISKRFIGSVKNDDGTNRANIKPFYVNQEDINSLNNIIKWVNNEKQNSLTRNRLFAKMFLKRMEYEIWRTSSYEIALDTITRELGVSLEAYYKTFQIDMMMFNFDMACQMVGVPDALDYEKGVTVEERKNHSKEMLKTLKDNEVELKKTIISDHWNEENTRVRLNDLITDIINKYGDRD